MTQAQAKIEEPTQNREIPFGRPWVEDADRAAVMDVLQGHILTHGPMCKQFEADFAEFTKGGTAVTMSSCMAALHMSTLHLGIKEGDEVIVPAQTHVATVHAVEILGATPVFADCELETGNIDIDLLESKITPKTKAIILVHFAGIPVEMDRLCAIADKHNIAVIEDCALAVGGFYKGKHVGLWGDMGCFSFYPVKHITTGEGGMLISKDEDTAQKIAHFRAFSVDRTHNVRKIAGVYDVTGVGLNYRMSEMQAALGCAQVAKLDRILSRRKENFAALKNMLQGAEGVRAILDSDNPDVTNSHYCLTVILDGKAGEHRNEVVKGLMSDKVGCSIYYPQPVARMKYYKDKYDTAPEEYKNAAVISDASIALPVGPHLDTTDMDIIAQTLKQKIASI